MLACAHTLYDERAFMRRCTQGELAPMANWLKWRTDYGESAYGELSYGEMTSYPYYLLFKLKEITSYLGQNHSNKL